MRLRNKVFDWNRSKLDYTTNNRKRKSWGICFKKQHWFHTAYNSLSGTARQRILCGMYTYISSEYRAENGLQASSGFSRAQNPDVIVFTWLSRLLPTSRSLSSSKNSNEMVCNENSNSGHLKEVEPAEGSSYTFEELFQNMNFFWCLK